MPCLVALKIVRPELDVQVLHFERVVLDEAAARLDLIAHQDGEDFVGLDRTSSLQRFLSDKAERLGRRLKLRVQLRSFDSVCRLVECNVGIGVVPETTAGRNMKTMKLHLIELTDDWALRNLTICVRRLSDLPLYAQELVRHLAEQPGARKVAP